VTVLQLLLILAAWLFSLLAFPFQASEGGLVVRLTESGVEAPLVVSPGGWKRLTGDPRSEHSIRSDCESGRLPTLPRAGSSGAHHRMPVAKALQQLGIEFEIVPSRAA